MYSLGMERQTQVNIRLSLEEKAQLLAKAKARRMGLSEYLRTRGLDEDSKPRKVPESPPDDPVLQQEVHKDFVEAAKKETEEDLIRKFKARGMTTPVARREARKNAD